MKKREKMGIDIKYSAKEEIEGRGRRGSNGKGEGILRGREGRKRGGGKKIEREERRKDRRETVGRKGNQ